ncbi:membrane fusion protein (multidrug efflux system) [Roseimicrobium gellanilyticum]|uniref:Membrane fusion protein (Multidrug efflux system) n=1 Tax=Roseimicrobium gellanilyticum TaxID=748857 RepID=A0A366HAY5_9BACT|nr:efflux RND transporter periplasmic adaptor subunit [Roseimicrobium gellanilyticum]RBP39069.1 membrane fusion protein (multidrug efflux system) [Roseimicrobium gellanilyticum]
MSRLSLSVGLTMLLAACDRNEAPPPTAPPEVLVLTASTQDVPVFREWVGTLDGSENAEIRARVTGYLVKRNYQEGAVVKKGEVLFEIDPRPFEAALAEARNQLAQVKAMQVAAAAEVERDTKLFKDKAVSERDLFNSRQANESQLAKIKALEAAEEQAKLNVQFCKIEAPVDGIAGISQAQVGDLVGTGSNVVLTSVSTLDPIKLVFPISETEYLIAADYLQKALAKPLNEREEFIELILADGKPFPHKGRLLAVDLNVKGATGTIVITALAANPGNILRPGLFARARIKTKVLEKAVVIPQRAVNEVQGTYQIGVVGANGKAEIRPVKAGPRTGSNWVITEGLKEGETVIVEGFQKVRAGAPVTAKPWTPPASHADASAATPTPTSQPAAK